ncbi:VWA domain-containing protein [Oceanobacillus piezotolerans]|uniref:VWA domain-containing protein n=1 Tax=Oceanobacillus piezotolerans TaxID=2448030 RepID=A0A498DAU5_9BACI|nr:VWA domain-containing protein [Oceanobacillus piezotolerans]RLL45150.1 VWA domain-containing protein [Oceanobacillus piezotolerans]
MVKRAFAIILVLLFLVACSERGNGSENQQMENNNPDGESEEAASEERKEFIEKASELIEYTAIQSREDMKAQKGGSLVKEMSVEEELNRTYPISEEVLKEELYSYADMTENPNELYNGIVYLLGSPHYNDLIQKAEAFEPSFQEPYLPEPSSSIQEDREVEIAQNGKAFILLDASSSMLQPVDDQIKMDVAKNAVKQFADIIGEKNEIALIVYGHIGSESETDKSLSCEGVEEVYPMESYEPTEFEEALNSFESKGYTPLAGAIHKANEISKDFTDPVTVFVVSDGVETCDGDPVKEAESFVRDTENRNVNIIGFNVDEDAESQLSQVAEAGSGNYYSANNPEELNTTIANKWLPSDTELAWAHTKAPGPWEILDEYDRFDTDLNQIRSVIQIEKDRYDKAVRMLSEEDKIDREAASELTDIILEEYRAKLDLMSGFRSEKLDEIDSAAEEIREDVDSWIEEMRKIKQEIGK